MITYEVFRYSYSSISSVSAKKKISQNTQKIYVEFFFYQSFQQTFTCSKSPIEILTIKTPDVNDFNFEHVSQLFLVFILLTLNK